MSPNDKVKAVVDPRGTLLFQTSEGYGNVWTVTVYMPGDKLESLSASGNAGILIQPGLKLNDLHLSVSADATVFSSSICAKTLSLDVSAHSKVSLHIPSNCEDMHISYLSGTAATTIAISSDAPFNGGRLDVSGGSMGSLDSGGHGGTVASMSVSGGGGLFVNMDVDHLEASGGAQYYARHVESENVDGGAGKAAMFMPVGHGLSANTLSIAGLVCGWFRNLDTLNITVRYPVLEDVFTNTSGIEMGLQNKAAQSLVVNNQHLTDNKTAIFKRNVIGIQTYRNNTAGDNVSSITLQLNSRSYHNLSYGSNPHLVVKGIPSLAAQGM